MNRNTLTPAIKLPRLWLCAIMAQALAAMPTVSFAGGANGYELFFYPQSVDTQDVPPDLARQYPNCSLVTITFQPANHPCGKDGSSLQPGEGSWLDRGMRPNEPAKIELILKQDDMLVHTLKASSGPFMFRVTNSRNGYMKTVPFLSPQVQIGQPAATADTTPAPAAQVTPTPGAVMTATGTPPPADVHYTAVPVTNPIPMDDGFWMFNPTLNDWTWASMDGWQYIRKGSTWKWNAGGDPPASHPPTPHDPQGGFPNPPPPGAGGPANP